MLKNAIDYEKRLALDSLWLRDSEQYKYYVFDDNKCIKLYKREPYREFASVNQENDSLVGFIRYYVKDNIAINVETICLDNEQKVLYGLDIFELLKHIFMVENLDLMKFSVNKNFDELNERYNSFIKKGLGKLLFTKNGYNFYQITKQNYLNYIKKNR